MDPVTLPAVVTSGISLLTTVIGFIVYHKWILPGTTAAAVPAPVPVVDVLNHPILHAALTHVGDVLKQLIAGTVKGGVSQVMVPVLAQLAKQMADTLAVAAPAPPKAA